MDEDCRIRAWRMEDAPALAEGLNNARVQAQLRDGLPYPYTQGDAEAYLSMLRTARTGAVYAFAIEADGRVVGNLSATRMENIHRRTAELGYFIAEPFWGRGYGTAAVRQACARIFQTTDIIRLFAQPFADNAASCRLLERCGFQCEGVLRRNAVKDGRVRDMKMYAILRPEA